MPPAGPTPLLPPGQAGGLPVRIVSLSSPCSILWPSRESENTLIRLTFLIPAGSPDSHLNLAASDFPKGSPRGDAHPWVQWPHVSATGPSSLPRLGLVVSDLLLASPPGGCLAPFMGAAQHCFRARHLLRGFPSFINEPWQQPCELELSWRHGL